MIRILYFGSASQTSSAFYRARALARLGHAVNLHDPVAIVPRTRWQQHVDQHVGYRLLQGDMLKAVAGLRAQIAQSDAIWVNAGQFFGARIVRYLKTSGVPVILYNNDDPTGGRDGRRFDMLREAIAEYSTCAVVRDVNVSEYQRLGADNVVRVWMSYDEIEHALPDDLDLQPDERSEVMFAGTWMRGEGRDAFLCELIDAGIPVAIRGDRWHKSPRWARLRSYWRGPAIYGAVYARAIRGAKISLGMLSAGNRDEYTRRSVEVPFAGGLLCAERTPAHQAMYAEGREAVFWSDATECAAQCRLLLADPARRRAIASAGAAKVRTLGAGNEEVCDRILQAAFAASATPRRADGSRHVA